MSTAALLCAEDADLALWRLCGVSLAARSAQLLRGCEPIIVSGGASVGAVVAAELPDHVVRSQDGGRDTAVRALLDATLGSEVDVVVVHEAVRALAPAALLERVVSTVRAGASAAVPVLAVSDTVKHVADDGTILSTVDRTMLRTVQTPYGLSRVGLKRLQGSADASWRAFAELPTVAGDPDAFAIDGPAARALAERVLGRRQVAP
jgi:2-C-methyl-D-erythritol 4-phosphate cytidylyltransferase